MASEGGTAGGLPDHPSDDAEELREAVETAHGLGRLTTADCRASASMKNAVEAGLDCIEHAEFLIPSKGMAGFGGGIEATSQMFYDPRITERILDGGNSSAFTARPGGTKHCSNYRRKSKVGPHQLRKRYGVPGWERYSEMKLEILSSLLHDGLLPRLAISSDAGPFDVSFGGSAARP